MLTSIIGCPVSIFFLFRIALNILIYSFALALEFTLYFANKPVGMFSKMTLHLQGDLERFDINSFHPGSWCGLLLAQAFVLSLRRILVFRGA